MHTKDLTHHAILSKSTVNSPRDRGPARTQPAGPLRAATLSTCRPHAPDAGCDREKVFLDFLDLAREAHDLEFMLCWEQELQELGHKAWQSRIIEDHAEFCRSCTPRMLATELDRQYWEAQELAREAHDLEFMSRNSPGIHL